MLTVRRACLMAGLGFVLCLSPALSRSATVSHFWSKAVGGATGNDTPIGVAVDVNGDVIVTGSFQGTVNFGGGNLVSAGLDDIFLAKYTSAGVHLWSKKFGSTGSDSGHAIAVDPNGLIYLTGSFAGTVNFGGSNLPSIGSDDIFIAGFAPDGTHFLSVNYGSTGSDMGNAIALDTFNNVLVTGTYSGTIFFTGPYTFTNAGSTDMFLMRFGWGNNVASWGYGFGGIGPEYAADVAFDASNNAYLLGRFRNTASFGGPALTSAGADDIVMAKFDFSGNYQWSKRFGNTNNDSGNSVAVYPNGDVLMLGGFDLAVNFGGSTLTATNTDIVLARYTTNGTHVWSKRYGGSDLDNAISLAIGANDEASVTGYFYTSTNLGGANLISGGNNDILLAHYDGSGNHLWSSRFGSPNFDFGIAVATDPSGDVVTTGGFFGAVNFGGATFTSAGAMDMYLAKYGANTGEPVITDINDVANDQGRRVLIAVRPSGLDNAEAPVHVEQYEAYLRVDPLPALAASASAAGRTLSAREAMLAQGWAFMAAVPAGADDIYFIEAATDADSTLSLGLHNSIFKVRAATGDPVTFYDSSPDSGYSKDNIAPPAPASFAINVSLSWHESPAEDFDYFSVYGSSASVFNSSAVLITRTTSTGAATGPTPYPYYYVTATDFSGNEGKSSKVNATTGVGDSAPAYTLGVNAYPNPFNPRTTIRYDVPSRGRAHVDVFDAAGARVVTLVDEPREAGSFSVSWDGRDEHGNAVSSGVYFVRLNVNGANTARKIALVK